MPRAPAPTMGRKSPTAAAPVRARRAVVGRAGQVGRAVDQVPSRSNSTSVRAGVVIMRGASAGEQVVDAGVADSQ
jgi:hypothetical protein